MPVMTAPFAAPWASPWASPGGAANQDFFTGGVNLFFNKADYDAYPGTVKSLADEALLASLGITDAGGVGGTYVNNAGNLATKSSGTAPRLTYDRGASSNLLAYSAGPYSNWSANGSATDNGAGAPISGYATTSFTRTSGSGFYRSLSSTPASGASFVIAHYVSRAAGSGDFVGGTDSGGRTPMQFNPDTGAFTSGPTNKYVAKAVGGWLIWAVYSGDGAAVAVVNYGSSSGSGFNVASWAHLGSTLLPYLPTTSTAPLYTAGTPVSQNLIGDSRQSSWTVQANVNQLAANVADPKGGTNAYRYDWSGAAVNSGIFDIGASYLLLTVGTVYTIGWWVRAVSGSGTVSMCDAVTTEATTSGIFVDTTWRFIRHRKTGYIAGQSMGPWLKKEAGSPSQIEVYLPHIYEGTADLQLANVPDTAGTGSSVYPLAGLLAEPAATNLHKYSGDLSQVSAWTWWTSVGASTIGPDGTTNMQQAVSGSGSGDFYFYQPAALTNGTRVVWSMYFKKGADYSWVHLRPTDSGAGIWKASFNLNAGTVGTTSGTGVVAGIEPGPNGTYRCWIAFTPTATGNGNMTFFVVNADNTQTLVGNGTTGIYAWGSQVEPVVTGDYPSTLIPTGATTASRTAGTCKWLPANIPGWVGSGTFTGGWYVPAVVGGGAMRIIGNDAGGVPSYLDVAASNAIDTWNGAVDLATAAGASMAGVPKLGAMRFSGAGRAICYDGGAVASDANTIPAPTYIYLGNDGNSSEQLGGLLRRLAYSPTLASNAQLQNLSNGLAA